MHNGDRNTKMENRRTGCRTQIVTGLICLIILIPATIIGGNILAHNNPLALGLLIGAGLGFVILVSAAAGSLWSAWLMRTGAQIARDVVESRSASEKAMSAVMRGAFQVMGERGELPPAQGWGYERFPMIEAPPEAKVDDDGFVA